MLKLYGGALSCASIVQWYLEELQVPYEYVAVISNFGKTEPTRSTLVVECAQPNSSATTFLTSDRFNVADVAVGSILAYIPFMLKMDVSAYPEVVNQKSIGTRYASGQGEG